MSEKAGHTKGPWYWIEPWGANDGGQFYCSKLEGPEGQEIISALSDCDFRVSEADAPLIKFAPELLEALELLVVQLDAEDCGENEAGEYVGNWKIIHDKARAAIKKARGEG